MGNKAVVIGNKLAVIGNKAVDMGSKASVIGNKAVVIGNKAVDPKFRHIIECRMESNAWKKITLEKKKTHLTSTYMYTKPL